MKRETSGDNPTHRPVRCGIVLAAGEGKRLQPFVLKLRGDFLPKQYVRLLGSWSMLEQTFHRAEKLIKPERLFTVVNRYHLNHPDVRQQLLSRAPGTVVIQPANKETGPGILLPLMHVYKRHPGALVAVFPSDHFIVEEDLFMDHVEVAFRAVERNSSSLVLLGTQPHEPEPEYGYIIPGREAHPGVSEVLQFVEKPPPEVALKLIEQGGLWNTMVTVFKVKTFLDLVRRADPRMYDSFDQIFQAIGTAQETDAINEVYRRMETVNFSKGLLAKFAADDGARLLVLAVRGVRWSDWGSERRITTALQNGDSRQAGKTIRNQENNLRRPRNY